MKNSLLICLAFLITNRMMAQETTLNDHLSLALGPDYHLSMEKNLGAGHEYRNTSAPFGSMTTLEYAIETKKVDFSISAVIRFHTGADSADLINSGIYTGLNSFTADGFNSAALMFGANLHFLPDNSNLKTTVFIKSGPVYLMLGDRSFDFTDQSYSFANSSAVGFANTIGLEMQPWTFDKTAIGFRLGANVESGFIPYNYYIVSDSGLSAGVDVFEWHSFSMFASLVLSLDL